MDKDSYKGKTREDAGRRRPSSSEGEESEKNNPVDTHLRLSASRTVRKLTVVEAT